ILDDRAAEFKSAYLACADDRRPVFRFDQHHQQADKIAGTEHGIIAGEQPGLAARAAGDDEVSTISGPVLFNELVIFLKDRAFAAAKKGIEVGGREMRKEGVVLQHRHDGVALHRRAPRLLEIDIRGYAGTSTHEPPLYANSLNFPESFHTKFTAAGPDVEFGYRASLSRVLDQGTSL
ncbi:MAG: hypothetical protein ACR2OW_02845, partial [Methyloligellaceae bacterium]